MSSRTSDPSAEILRTLTPAELRTRLAWFQEQHPDDYSELLATLRYVAHEQAAPANAEHADGIRLLRQGAPGLMDSIEVLAAEWED